MALAPAVIVLAGVACSVSYHLEASGRLFGARCRVPGRHLVVHGLGDTAEQAYRDLVEQFRLGTVLDPAAAAS